MRAHEFLSESEMHDWHKQGIPGMKSLTGVNQYYDLYRFGMELAAAGAPDSIEGNTEGVTGDNPTPVSYTSVDNDIIEKALKRTGRTATTISDPQSREPKDTNVQSPVQPRGPVKRKS